MAKVRAAVEGKLVRLTIFLVVGTYKETGEFLEAATLRRISINKLGALPHVTDEFLRRGHSEEGVHGILGEDHLRVLEGTRASLCDDC